MRSSSPSVSTRGPPGAGHRAVHPAVREGADDRVGELGSSAAICPRSCARAARSSAIAADVADVEHAARVYRAPRASESASAQPNSASSTCSAGTPGTATAKSRSRALSRRGPTAGRDVAEEHRHRAGGVGHDDAPGREVGRVLALPQALARRRAAQPQRARPAARRRAPTPGRRSRPRATSSASSSGPRETKPPCTRRSSAAASTGVRCASGSRPTWRKKTR